MRTIEQSSEYFDTLNKTLKLGMNIEHLATRIEALWDESITREHYHNGSISTEDADYYWETLGNRNVLRNLIKFTEEDKNWCKARWGDMIDNGEVVGWLFQCIEGLYEYDEDLHFSNWENNSESYTKLSEMFEEVFDKKEAIINTYFEYCALHYEHQVNNGNGIRARAVRSIEKHFLEAWWNPHTPLGERRFEIEREKLFGEEEE